MRRELEFKKLAQIFLAKLDWSLDRIPETDLITPIRMMELFLELCGVEENTNLETLYTCMAEELQIKASELKSSGIADASSLSQLSYDFEDLMQKTKKKNQQDLKECNEESFAHFTDKIITKLYANLKLSLIHI